MTDIVSLLTGSFFLYFGIKLLLTKIFVDIAYWVFTNKLVLIILVGGIISYTILPVTQPYINATINLFIQSIISIVNYIWTIIYNILHSILGSGVTSFLN